MMAWLRRVALCLLDRLLRQDVAAREAAAVLEAERRAANEAPSSREDAAGELGKGKF